jgi:hypothetical protein
MRRNRFFHTASVLSMFCGLSVVPTHARFNKGGDGGTSGSGGGSDSDEVSKRIADAVEKAISPIRQNRDDILVEKRKVKESLDLLQSQIDSLGGSDGLKNLLEVRERLSKDEMGKLLADGKHDEWFDRRAAAMRRDFENKLKSATDQAEIAAKERDLARTHYANEKIDTTVMQAATKAGIVDTAVDDVLLRAKNSFTFDPRAGVCMKDQDGQIILGKDGKSPKGVSEWLDEMKDKARHWFAGSRGAGAEGNMAGGNGALSDAQVANMSMSEYKDYRKKQGVNTGWAGRFSP